MANVKSVILGRGTTAVYHLKFPGVDTADVRVLWVTFAQPGVELTDTAPELTKMLTDDVTIDETGVTVGLSQEETLRFKPDENFLVQIRGLLTNGFAFASEIVTGRVLGILKDGVISDGDEED